MPNTYVILLRCAQPLTKLINKYKGIPMNIEKCHGDIAHLPVDVIIACPVASNDELSPVVANIANTIPEISILHKQLCLTHTLFVGGTTLWVNPDITNHSVILLAVAEKTHDEITLEYFTYSIRSMLLDLERYGHYKVALPVEAFTNSPEVLMHMEAIITELIKNTNITVYLVGN